MSAPQLVTIGDNVVDCYLDYGYMYPGGNAVNVAVHGRRVGVPAAYIGAVGNDAAGSAIVAALETEGVDTGRVRVLPGGNRVFTGGAAGVSKFDPDEDDLRLVGAVRLVHTGECSMLEDHLALLARRSRRLSFDFSERPWEYIAALAPLVDVAIASLPESDAARAEDLAREIRACGPSVVAVTRGAEGAVLLTDELYTSVAGDGPVIDTLGAGDSFIARLLAGLLRGEPPRGLVQAASTYATLSCGELGAFGHRTPLPESLSLPPERHSVAQH
jgi:fructoselysine 6-kinase